MKKLSLGILISLCTLPVVAESNFSAELLVGTADQKSTIKNIGSTSGDDLSVGVRGVLNLNKNVAFEFAYQNYGETDDTFIDEFGDIINDKVSSTAFNVGVKGIIPLENKFSIHGRAGISFWDAEIKETDSAFPGQTFKVDDDGNDLYYGVGLQYEINSQFVIGAEYSITEMGVSLEGISADHEVKNLSLSLAYQF